MSSTQQQQQQQQQKQKQQQQQQQQQHQKQNVEDVNSHNKEILFCYIGLAMTMLCAHLFHVPVYVHMMLSALFIIYIGCYGSIKAQTSTSEQTVERMTTKDAYMFPVYGSFFLFSLYLVYKFLPKEYVNMLFKAYFFLFGMLVLANNISQILKLLIASNTFDQLNQEIFRVYIPFVSSSSSTTTTTNKKNDNIVSNANDNKTPISKLDIVCHLIAAVVGGLYLQYNHWSCNNIFGISFSIQGIELLSLGSFFNGFVLLSGLFVYDIFWVFGTDVMVTVAKSFDAPIKLLFPRPHPATPSLLGLGDIVVPGFFIALMLRFDRHISAQKGHTNAFYFWHLFVGYFIGLTTTVLVMYQFQAAQPALLYLVPACLGAAFVAALRKGQVHEMWNFKEGEDDEHQSSSSSAATTTSSTVTSSSPKTTTTAELTSSYSSKAATTAAVVEQDESKPVTSSPISNNSNNNNNNNSATSTSINTNVPSPVKRARSRRD